jgi:drug/metabolite transporter (DMT)-like permease
VSELRGDRPVARSLIVSSGTLAAHGAMLLFALLVSSSFTVGAAITGPLAPLPLTFLRFLIATIVFAVVILACRQWRLPSMHETFTALLLALSVTGYFVAMFEALLLTSALNTGALFALVPLMTAALSVAIVGQRVNPQLGLGLLIAAAGSVWVVFGGSLERMRSFHLGLGEWIFLGGCAAYAAYSPLIRLLDRGTPSLLMSFWTIVAGAVLLALYAGPSMLATDWAGIPASVYLGILHLALFTTAATFFLIQYASTRLPQAKVMAYTYLVPAFILLTDGLLSGRWPPPEVQAGVALIAAAMLVLQRA